LLIELKRTDLTVELQKPVKVIYENELVGDFIADMLVSDTVIVELKSVKNIVQAHEFQLVNYLTATNKPIGLLINFGEHKVEVERKYKDSSPKEK